MKRLFALLVVLVIVNITAATPVVFNDPALKVAVENQVGLDPEPADMLLLTNLPASSLGIVDLTGLEYATNLKTLDLQNNDINDVSPLSGLTKLTTLFLSRNKQIHDINSLSGLTKLLYFRVSDCNITNISVVANFPVLEGLSASDSYAYPGNNNISDINSLNNRTSLRYLYIYGNNISNLAPLATIPELLELDVADNNIANVNDINGLTKLTFLNVRYNYITDINPLSGLTKLVYLFASFNDNISDINAISDMNNLAELGLTDVNLSTITPLADVNQIKVLWLGYNMIEDINALRIYKKLTWLNLVDNPLSFRSWCPYLRQIKDNNPAAEIETMPVFKSLIHYGSTDVNDLQIFLNRWLNGPDVGPDYGCDSYNAFCNCADCAVLNGPQDGKVDFVDYARFAEWWIGL